MADRFYGGRPDVLLLTLDPTRLTSPVRVEDVGHDEFPHVYGPLHRAAVVDVRLLPLEPDGRVATGVRAIP